MGCVISFLKTHEVPFSALLPSKQGKYGEVDTKMLTEVGYLWEVVLRVIFQIIFSLLACEYVLSNF